MLKSLAISTLEQSVNAYISLDPEVETLLQPLVDKNIIIHVQGLNLSLLFTIYPTNIAITDVNDEQADVRISGSPLALLAMHRASDKAEVLFGSGIEIDGDTDIAQHFGDLFAKLHIDWEEHLAQFIGDPLAHSLGNLVKNTLSWGKETKNTVQKNMTEYLQEELAFLPPREEVSDFMDDVDTLRHDVERTQAKLQQLYGTAQGEQE